MRVNYILMGDIDHDNGIEHSTNIIHGASNISVAQKIYVDKNEDHRENSVIEKQLEGGQTVRRLE